MRIPALLAGVLIGVSGCCSISPVQMSNGAHFTLDENTQVDAALQSHLETIDARLRNSRGMEPQQSAVGLLDIKSFRLAMIRPDQIEYAASVPKIAILLAYLQIYGAAELDSTTRHELGLMIKQSDNELAAKYSQQLGLKRIQQILQQYGLYSSNRGGIWIGKHYGVGTERYPEPISGHSHTATVRQLLRFYLMLEQGRLVSAEASQTMKEIFASPELPHLQDRFVKGLEDRNVELLRKSGWWEDWFHDTAIIAGPSRRYVLVAMTHHREGDAYLAELAAAVDDLLSSPDQK